MIVFLKFAEATRSIWVNAVTISGFGLQLFGAMGFTWENDLQFALKRAKAGELMLGGTAEHRATVTEEYRAAHL